MVQRNPVNAMFYSVIEKYLMRLIPTRGAVKTVTTETKHFNHC